MRTLEMTLKINSGHSNQEENQKLTKQFHFAAKCSIVKGNPPKMELMLSNGIAMVEKINYGKLYRLDPSLNFMNK